MKKKNIYILLIVIIVAALVIIFSGPKQEIEGEEITNEPEEEILTEETEGILKEEIIEKEETIPFFAKDVDLEISSDKGINIDKFRVKGGELINISLTNQDETKSYTIKFDDPFFKDFMIIVPAGKDKVRISSVTVPIEPGEYKFTCNEGEFNGVMIVE